MTDYGFKLCWNYFLTNNSLHTHLAYLCSVSDNSADAVTEHKCQFWFMYRHNSTKPGNLTVMRRLQEAVYSHWTWISCIKKQLELSTPPKSSNFQFLISVCVRIKQSKYSFSKNCCLLRYFFIKILNCFLFRQFIQFFVLHTDVFEKFGLLC